MIKNMLKRRKESGAHLTTDGRHRWNLKMMMMKNEEEADEGRSAG